MKLEEWFYSELVVSLERLQAVQYAALKLKNRNT